jgi:WD40 repeat protein
MDFSKRIQDLTAEFVGREWLLRQVTDFLSHDTKRYLVIVGEAGIGKSAIAARLLQVKHIHAYHFCSVLEGGKLEPNAFVASLSTQLSQHLLEFSECIVERAPSYIRGSVNVGELQGGIAAGVYIEKFIAQTKSANEAFQYLVREPLEDWVTKHNPTEPIIILVDSLDEAVRLDRHPNILDLIRLTQDLPQPVRWLMTSRPGRHLSTLPGARIEMLDKSSDNLKDVRLFIANVLSEPAVSAALKSSGQDIHQLTEELQQRSGGNFLYLRFVLTGMRDDAVAGRPLGTIDRLPVGLAGLYKEFLERALSDKTDEWTEVYRPVLGVLATTQESLSLAQLSAFSGIKAQLVNDVLVSLRELLDLNVADDSGTHRIFHTSFKDFLTDIKVNPDFWVDPQDFHQQISSYYFNKYGGDWEECDRYGLQYLPSHLNGAGLTGKLRELLLDFNWLQAKLTALDVNSVLSDFKFLPGDAELDLVKGAIRLAAHNLSTEKTQLAGQLLGRLLGHDSKAIQALLDQASQWRKAKWLRPLTRCLSQPGGHLVNTIKAHVGIVDDLSIASDGAKMVSGSSDHTVKVWDLRTGLELHTLRGHDAYVTGVAISADGRLAVSSSHEQTLKVWDVQEGQELLTLPGHANWVTCVALTPDGQTAVSGSTDNTVRVWDTKSGQLLRTLSGHDNHVQKVAVMSQQRRILSASWDRTLRCWDMDTGNQLAVLDQTEDLSFTAVAVSADDRIAVWACGMGANIAVSVWDMTENRRLFTLHGHTGMIKSVAISPDGRRAASASWDRTIRIWDLVNGVHLRTFQDNDDLAVVKFLDSRQVISGSYEGKIKIWDIDCDSGESALTANATPITAAAIGIDGHAIVGRFNGTIEIWDKSGDSSMSAQASHSYAVNAVKTTSDGPYFVSASDDGTLKVWETKTGALVRTLEGHASPVRNCSLSEDGQSVISYSDDKVFKVWELDSGVELKALADKDYPEIVSPGKAYIGSLAFTPDGRRSLYPSVVRDKYDSRKIYLNIWDWKTDAFHRILTSHTDYVRAVAITADGRVGVSASDDRTLEVWDLDQLKKVHVLEGHTHWIHHVVITPDGKRAISATGTSYFSSTPQADLRIWDLTNGAELKSLNAGLNVITSLVVTRDGRRIVFTSDSGDLQVWDIETGERIARFNSEYGLFALAVSLDGSTIVTGGKSGKVHLLVLEG